MTAAIVIGEIIGAIMGGWIATARSAAKKSMRSVAVGYIAFCLLSAAAWNVTSLWVARCCRLHDRLSAGGRAGVRGESVPARIRGATLVYHHSAAHRLVRPGRRINHTAAHHAGSGPGDHPDALPTPAAGDCALNYAQGRRGGLKVPGDDHPDADIDSELDETQAPSARVRRRHRQILRKPTCRRRSSFSAWASSSQITINATVTYGPKIFGGHGASSPTSRSSCSTSASVHRPNRRSLVSCGRWTGKGRRPILLTGIGIMIFAQLLMVIYVRHC